MTKETRGWPTYLFNGRIRTSTAALIVAFLLAWWLYETYRPVVTPAQPVPATQVVPPGFVPDPAYTWVPRTSVREWPTMITTTTTTTSPTTTTTSPTTTETTSPTSPTSPTSTPPGLPATSTPTSSTEVPPAPGLIPGPGPLIPGLIPAPAPPPS